MARPVEVIIPKHLKDLGLKILLGEDSLYRCIDTDGCELKSFELEHQAIEYLEEGTVMNYEDDSD